MERPPTKEELREIMQRSCACSCASCKLTVLCLPPVLQNYTPQLAFELLYGFMNMAMTIAKWEIAVKVDHPEPHVHVDNEMLAARFLSVLQKVFEGNDIDAEVGNVESASPFNTPPRTRH